MSDAPSIAQHLSSGDKGVGERARMERLMKQLEGVAGNVQARLTQTERK